MNDREAQKLISAYLHDGLSGDEMDRLRAWIAQGAGNAREFAIACSLNQLAGELFEEGRIKETNHTASGRRLSGLVILAVSLGVIVAGLSLYFLISPEARIGSSHETRWLSRAMGEGTGLRKGDLINLASGSVEIQFRSGARSRIFGPVLFEIASPNGGFLHYGEALSQANTDRSSGFTIETRAGRFVDQGTEFLTTALTDGFSQMHVSSGAVDALLDGFGTQRFETGNGIGIEPGSSPVVIRIEKGAETDTFQFPSISPPSNDDFAGAATIRLYESESAWVESSPHHESGSVELLVDGRGQSDRDEPGESLFLPNGADATIFMDLGEVRAIDRIVTYSWHLSVIDIGKKRRAVQRYTLWGCGDELPDKLPSREDTGEWTRIARVDTDVYFGVSDRPAQQACSLIPEEGQILGSFRYLLFDLVPTPLDQGRLPRHTFFGEIDVFSESQL